MLRNDLWIHVAMHNREPALDVVVQKVQLRVLLGYWSRHTYKMTPESLLFDFLRMADLRLLLGHETTLFAAKVAGLGLAYWFSLLTRHREFPCPVLRISL